MFDIGEEVICVDDENQGFGGKDVFKGQKYRIRWIGRATHPSVGTHLCVRLEGVFRPSIIEWDDPELEDMPLRATRFAPIKKKETDISVFKEILNKVTETENV